MIYTLIKKDNKDKVSAIFSFDSLNSFDESWSATVTTQTVESGFNISDNINIEPPTYDLDGVISEYSIFDADREIVWSEGGFTTKTIPDKNRHIKARDYLIDLFNNRSVLTILETDANSNTPDFGTKYEELKSGYVNEIDNCVMTSLSISYPSSSSSAFFINIKLQKINIALVEVAQLADNEVAPLLQPLAPSETSEGTVSKTTRQAVTDEDGNIIAMNDSPEPSASVTPTTDGISFQQGQAIADIKDGVVKNQIRATQAQLTYMKYTGINDVRVVLKNGDYSIEQK